MMGRDYRTSRATHIPGHDWLTHEQSELLSQLNAGFRSETEYEKWAHKVRTYSVPEKEAPGLKVLYSANGTIPHALLTWPEGEMKRRLVISVAMYLVRKGFRRESHAVPPPEATPLEALPGVSQSQRIE